MSFSRLTTADLVDRATRAVSDPDVSPYSARTSKALQTTLASLAETNRRHGPPPGFDTLRELSLSILVDFDTAETDRATERLRRPTAAEVEAARGAHVDALAGVR